MAKLYQEGDIVTSEKNPADQMILQNGKWQKYTAPEPEGSTLAGTGKALASGAVKGAIGMGSIPGDVRELSVNLGGKLATAMGADPAAVEAGTKLINKYGKYLPGGASSAENRADLEKLIGPLYEPEKGATAEQYAHTIGEFVPGLATPGGWLKAGTGLLGKMANFGANVLKKGARDVVAPAVGSETAGQVADYMNPSGTASPYARVGGALMGGRVLPHLVTPNPMSAERKLAMDTMRRTDPASVNSLSAGRYTGSPNLEAYENTVAGPKFNEQMNRAFTQDVNKRAGVMEPSTGYNVPAENVGGPTVMQHRDWLNQRALMQAVGRAVGQPAGSAAQLRQDQAMFRPIEQAAAYAEGTPPVLNPQNFKREIVRNDADQARFANQTGPYDPLVRFGETHMGPMQGQHPGIGEATSTLSSVGLAHVMGGDPTTKILAAMIGPILHKTVGSPLSAAEKAFIMSPWGQTWLKNQILAQRTPSEETGRMVNALLGSSVPARLPPPSSQ